MILFIRNIPESTRPSQLKSFVEPALKRRWSFLPAHGQVLKVEIISLLNTSNKLVEHHGLVFLDSKPAVEIALKNLRGKRLNNRALQIREYQHRSLKNERREFNPTPQMFDDQRQHDRRRGEVMQHLENLNTMSLLL